MAAGRLLVPDVLVLAAGGVVGEAWMTGVLAGIEDAAGIDLRRTELLIGTSAGAIVAAALAAGRSPRRPPAGASAAAATRESHPTASGPRRLIHAAAGAAWAATAPLAATALALNAPGGALARSLLLARIPGGRRSLDDLRRAVAESGARFDGRLRVVAVDRASGRRVVFGAPGAPETTVADAVAASCAVPWIFAPVRIGGRAYVDGGAWSPSNLDVAPVGRDSQVLCLAVGAAPAAALASPLGALRAAARATLAVEAQALRHRGARVRTIGPDAGAAHAIGGDPMGEQAAPAALAEGFRQGREVGRVT